MIFDKTPEGRAYSPKLKRLIIERLYGAWCATDDMRLGQLVSNTADDLRTDLFYMEDQTLIEAIETFVERTNP